MHLLAAYEQPFALACAVLLSLAMLLVIVLDATRYLIPNSLNLAILILYVFAAYMLHFSVLFALLAAALVLFVGLGLFALGLMGGGDIKLLTVLTLWTGWSHITANFLLLTAMVGGILVLIVLPMRWLAPSFYRPQEGRTLPRLLTRKQPVPYGLAVAGAFLILLVAGTVPGLPKFF